MPRRFVYLAAELDWFIGRVLSWLLSFTIEVESCVEAFRKAPAKCTKYEEV
jgi:putative transposase